MSNQNIQVAKKWREQHEYEGRGGVVVIFAGEVQGWCNELRNPDHWQPGCVAVDEHGNQWMAGGGNAYDGAKCWQLIQRAA